MIKVRIPKGTTIWINRGEGESLEHSIVENTVIIKVYHNLRDDPINREHDRWIYFPTYGHLEHYVGRELKSRIYV